MRKVFHFDAPREHYRCDAAVVWCFDNRFRLGFSKFLKRLGIDKPDSIQIAGGAKCLASPERPADREFVIDQIRKSIRLHATGLVILMTHSDCGGYGGLSAFGNDASAEAEHHVRELSVAARCVREQVSGVAVQAYFVDFQGVWEIDLLGTDAEAGTALALPSAS